MTTPVSIHRPAGFVIWILGTAAAAALVGYGLASGKAPAGEQPDLKNSSKSGTGRPGPSSSSGDPIAKGPGAERFKTMRRELLTGYRSSSNSLSDWDLIEKSDRYLKEMPSADLAAFYQQVDNGLGSWAVFLRQKILHELLLKDPRTAIAIVDESYAVNAFMTWGGRDKEAALAWLEDSVPPALEKQKLNMRINLLLNLAKTDFPRVEQELATMESGGSL